MTLHKNYFRIITIASLLGILVTAYLLYQHFKPAGSTFCNVSEFVSCDVVNKSKYAEILGIPFALIGFMAYSMLFIATRFEEKIHSHNLVPHLALFAGTGVAISLYLTYVEFFILYAICILCLTQQILIIIIFITLCFVWYKHRKSLRLFS